MSRVMRVGVMMMRKHNRALDGTVGVGRLETGAHNEETIQACSCASSADANGDTRRHFSQGGS